jgi:WD40 repeat protein
MLKLNSQASQFLAEVRDAIRFILYNRQTIENTPLQIYTSALIFSPTNSLIRKLFKESKPTWTAKPVVKSNWDDCLQTLEGHSDLITTVAISLNGRWVSSNCDEEVRVWDALTGKMENLIADGRTSFSRVFFSPARNHLVIEERARGRVPGGVWVWNLEKASIHTKLTLTEANKKVDLIEYSPDGKLLASYSRGDLLSIWDSDTGKLLHEVAISTDNISAISFVQIGDQLQLAAAPLDKCEVYLWDFKGNNEIQIRELEDGCYISYGEFVFSPDGQLVTLTRFNQRVSVWSTETGKLVCEHISCDSRGVKYLVFFSDGIWLAICGYSATIEIFDITKRAVHQTIIKQKLDRVSPVFSPDKRLMVTGQDNIVRIWDMDALLNPGDDDPLPEKLTDTEIKISRDGESLVVAAADGTLRVLDANTGEVKRILKSRFINNNFGGKVVLDFSFDAQRVLYFNDRCEVESWNLQTEKVEKIVQEKQPNIVSLIVAPDRLWLTISGTAIAQIWNMENGNVLYDLPNANYHSLSIFLVGGQQMATFSEKDSVIHIWNLKEGTEQRLQSEGDVVAFALSPDGKLLASGYHNNTVRIWDTKNWTGPPQIVEIGREIRHLVLDSKSQLTIDIGSFIFDPSLSGTTQKAKRSGYGIESSWINFNDTKVL